MNSRKYYRECNLLLTKLTSIEAIKMRLGRNECGNGALRKYPYPEFSVPYFPEFGLNTGGKIRTRELRIRTLILQ